MKNPDFQSTLTNYKTRIDKTLEELLPKKSTSKLAEAMNYSVLNGGKRLRPILVYLSSQMGSETLDKKSVDHVAAAVELMHCYSLIHDDLPAMDDDELRRGLPTCHMKFNEAIAILAGDALQPLAYEIIIKSPNLSENQKIYILKKLMHACGFKGMVEGQMLDLICNERNFSLKELDLMHGLKTGKLIKTSLLLGANLARFNKTMLKAILSYGEKLGLAFQIRDDIIDIESPEEVSGKKQGSDILQKKITYPALIGMDESKKRASLLMEEAINSLSVFSQDTTDLKNLAYYVIERTS